VTYWHFTCEHTYAAIGDAGALLPACQISNHASIERWWPARFVWLTNLPVPDRDGLGLTMRVTRCDRIAYRYRVTDDEGIVPWVIARKAFRTHAHLLEDVPGVRPAHWYVSAQPVPVILDQR
jgi:hypothetical protein